MQGNKNYVQFLVAIFAVFKLATGQSSLEYDSCSAGNNQYTFNISCTMPCDNDIHISVREQYTVQSAHMCRGMVVPNTQCSELKDFNCTNATRNIKQTFTFNGTNLTFPIKCIAINSNEQSPVTTSIEMFAHPSTSTCVQSSPITLTPTSNCLSPMSSNNFSSSCDSSTPTINITSISTPTPTCLSLISSSDSFCDSSTLTINITSIPTPTQTISSPLSSSNSSYNSPMPTINNTGTSTSTPCLTTMSSSSTSHVSPILSTSVNQTLIISQTVVNSSNQQTPTPLEPSSDPTSTETSYSNPTTNTSAINDLPIVLPIVASLATALVILVAILIILLTYKVRQFRRKRQLSSPPMELSVIGNGQAVNDTQQ